MTRRCICEAHLVSVTSNLTLWVYKHPQNYIFQSVINSMPAFSALYFILAISS